MKTGLNMIIRKADIVKPQQSTLELKINEIFKYSSQIFCSNSEIRRILKDQGFEARALDISKIISKYSKPKIARLGNKLVRGWMVQHLPSVAK
jgi:hypothetical protein